VARTSVLHLVHTIAYGGIETAIINWLRRLDRSRFDVHLACFANPGETERPFVEAAEAHGLHVDKIPWARRKPLIRSARALAALLETRRVDILHTHNPYADFVGLIASRMRRVKTITTVYVWDDLGWKRNVLQWLDRLAIRHFDRISAHCEDTYKRTLALGLPAHKVNTLICGYEIEPLTLDADERRTRRQSLGAADDDVVLVNAARLWPEKAQDRLLRCFRKIADRHPNVRLWIAGVGPSEQALRQLTRELRLEDKVQFLGFVTQLAELLALVDIQIDPAQAAGVSLAICSGMAAGLPIVAADVGGLHEVVKTGHTGILVPRDDESAYVDAVSRMIEHPAERRRVGNAARTFIETRYSLHCAVEQVEATYRNLMS
jgi:glycosyltransferase involved in cell wall biosynthesis